MARQVLDQLLDSGELRSVASQRALALRMHYMPPRIRLELPGSDDYLPYLDANRRGSALSGLRDAILRVMTHEEEDHWVVVDRDMTFDVSLREGARRPRIRPLYEPEVAADGLGAPELGEPRIRLSVDGKTVLLRQRQGLVKVDLGWRGPDLVVFEGHRGDVALAYLYATGPVIHWSDRGRVRHAARTRIPIERDMQLSLRRPWTRPWHRIVPCEVEVLGLARMGRPDVVLTSSLGETVRWDRNRRSELELGPELLIRTGDRDVLAFRNTGQMPLTIDWFEGEPLLVAPGQEVAIQGAHFGGLTTPGGIRWDATHAQGASAPPPRIVELVGELPRGGPARTASSSPDPLFHFERMAADVLQDALVLHAVEGSKAQVVVKRDSSVGPIAQVALDDCPGVKVRPVRSAGPGTGIPPWQQVTDVRELGHSSARLEAVATPQVVFAIPRHTATLSTDPTDQLRLGGWRIGMTVDGLVLTCDGDEPLVVDGTSYEGSTHLEHRDVYRVRAGAGIYRIVRSGGA